MRENTLFFYFFIGLFVVSSDAYSQQEPILRIPSQTYEGFSTIIDGIDLSPDESTIAIAGDFSMACDLQTGEIIKTLSTNLYDRNHSVDYSSDGKLLALTIWNGVRVFDTDRFDIQYSLPMKPNSFSGFPGSVDITFYPDDSLLLLSWYGTLNIWDYKNVTLVKTLDNPNSNSAGVIFIDVDNNIQLAGSSIFINLDTGLEIDPGIKPEILEKTSFSISYDREFFMTKETTYINSQKDGKIITLYNRESQEVIWSYTHNTYDIIGYGLSMDGKLLVLVEDYHAQIIDFSSPECPKVVRTYPFDRRYQIRGLKITKDEKKLILANLTEVLVYDISDLNTCVENAVLH